MTVALLLQRYGVIALAFHYFIFFTTWAALYGILSFEVVDLASLPPDVSSALASWAGSGAGEDGNVATGLETTGRAGASFAILEVIGPARLALDVVATPPLARALRRFRWVRDAEERLLGGLARAQAKDDSER